MFAQTIHDLFLTTYHIVYFCALTLKRTVTINRKAQLQGAAEGRTSGIATGVTQGVRADDSRSISYNPPYRVCLCPNFEVNRDDQPRPIKFQDNSFTLRACTTRNSIRWRPRGRSKLV